MEGEKPMHLQPVFRFEGHSSKLKAAGNYKNTYSASPGEIRSAVVNEFHGVKVVGGEVAEDLFNRGLCPPAIASRSGEAGGPAFGDSDDRRRS